MRCAQGRKNLRLIRWARKEKAAEEQRTQEMLAQERLSQEEAASLAAREEAAWLEKEEEEERLRQIESDVQLAAETAEQEAELAKEQASASCEPVAESVVDEVVEELEGEETDLEEAAPPTARKLINIDEHAVTDSEELRAAMAAARKVAGTARCPALIHGPTNQPRFGDVKAWVKYLALGRKPFRSERPFHSEALASPEFRQSCQEMGITRLVDLNEKGSYDLTREIYANILWRYEANRALKFKVRGRVLRLDGAAIDAFLGREAMEEAELEAQWTELGRDQRRAAR